VAQGGDLEGHDATDAASNAERWADVVEQTIARLPAPNRRFPKTLTAMDPAGSAADEAGLGGQHPAASEDAHDRLAQLEARIELIERVLTVVIERAALAPPANERRPEAESYAAPAPEPVPEPQPDTAAIVDLTSGDDTDQSEPDVIAPRPPPPVVSPTRSARPSAVPSQPSRQMASMGQWLMQRVRRGAR